MKITEILKKKFYIVLFLAALIAEVFVFNFRFWQSIGYKPLSAAGMQTAFGEGIEVLNGKEVRIKPEGDRLIEFSGINAHIDNIYLNIYDKRCESESYAAKNLENSYRALNVTLYMTDKGNKQPFELPQRVVAAGVERTKYIKFQTAGVSEKIRIALDESTIGQIIVIDDLIFNAHVPFCFYPARLLLVFFAALAVCFFRKGSKVYDIEFVWDKRQKLITLLSAFVTCGICVFVWLSHPFYHKMDAHEEYIYDETSEGAAYSQYDELAKAFMRGKVHLLQEPPKILSDLENPYDDYERQDALYRAGETCAWDHSYYNGKYYVYFGVLPVLVYYLPYRLIFGARFYTCNGVLINILLFVVFSYLLLKSIISRWFKKVPFAVYIILCNVFVFSSQLIFALKKPDMYFMPITMALVLVTGGLWLWISGGGENGVKLFFGSLLMALVAACRPQFLLVSFLAVPLFANEVFKERTLFSKKSLVRSAAFVLPYVAVAAAVMWYNYARFGSVLEFGVKYNLTTNDITARGFNAARTPLGFFSFFIQLPNNIAVFPYLEYILPKTDYMGVTINEAMFGGIFATQPILWLYIKLKSVSREFKKKHILGLVLAVIVLAFLTGLADAQMSGILSRYYLDFSYLAVMAAVFIAFALCEKKTQNAHTVWVLSALCFVFTFLMFFTAFDPRDIKTTYPDIYYSLSSALTFWM